MGPCTTEEAELHKWYCEAGRSRSSAGFQASLGSRTHDDYQKHLSAATAASRGASAGSRATVPNPMVQCDTVRGTCRGDLAGPPTRRQACAQHTRRQARLVGQPPHPSLDHPRGHGANAAELDGPGEVQQQR